ncbi:nucleotide pyrophosphohydrolase [Burkholderia sp. L27(2015)]|uniref:nucleotide pyrophosphohydrolase n=1 Tax=Burkholderia sp. L27(2015) TaxID=1641858 RepID=UPI0020B1195D|nr:nucleotide pyrophosphohydrolase [Burkholderia sp. L27(2015)]
MNLIETKQLELVLAEFAKTRNWERFHSPKNLAMALSVEVAELVEIFQWKTEVESKIIMEGRDAQHVEQELADIALYLVRLAAVLGVNLNAAIESKLILNAIKHPAPKA